MGLHNLAKMTTSTVGTGTLTLGLAESGYNTFANAGVIDQEVVTYVIEEGNHRETGYGVYNSADTTLTRQTVLSSTNGGAKIVLTGGAKVSLTVAAEDIKSVNRDPVGSIVRRTRSKGRTQTVTVAGRVTNKYELMDGRVIQPESLDDAASLYAAVPDAFQPDLNLGITWPGSSTANSWVDIDYMAGIYVAVSSTGNIASSTDGMNWVMRATGVGANFSAVANNGSVFVAVAASTSTIYVSTNGISWLSKSLPYAYAWSDITWNGSVFCVVSTSSTNIACTSPDGITWTSRTLPATNQYSFVSASSSGLFLIAYAYANVVYTSPDGITWTSRSLPTSGQWKAARWSGSKWLLVGSVMNTCCTSSDGVTWTSVGWPGYATGTLMNIATNGSGQFVVSLYATSGAAGFFLVSNDSGDTWTASCVSPNFSVGAYNMVALWYGGGKYVALPYSGTGVGITSVDGFSWTNQPPILIPPSTCVVTAWNGSVYVTVGSNTNLAQVSSDGQIWKSAVLPIPANWTGIVWNGAVFIAIASGTTQSGNLSNFCATSPDGITWTHRTLPVASTWDRIAVNGSIVTVLSSTTSTAYSVTSSDNGVTWSSGQLVTSAASAWKTIADNGSTLVSVAGANFAYSTNGGNTWTVGLIPGGITSAFGVAWNGSVFCTITNTVSAVSSDGISWTAYPQSVSFGGTILTVGGLFVAPSSFTLSGFLTSPDGITWTPRFTGSAPGYSAIGSTENAVAFANGRFIRVSNQATAYYSSDGVWWYSTPISSASWSGLCYGPTNTWIACGNVGNYIARSTDNGVTWATVTVPPTNGFKSVSWNGSVFCAVTNGASGNCWTSPDGSAGSWTQRSFPASATWVSLAWNGSVFCAISSGATNAATSSDGVTWSAATLLASGTPTNLVWNGSVFCYALSGTTSAYTSPDGVTWTANTLPVTGTWENLSWGASLFVLVPPSSTVAVTSPDGVTWTQRTGLNLNTKPSLAYGAGRYVRTGANSSNYMGLSSDGITWANGYFVTIGSGSWSVGAAGLASNGTLVYFSTMALGYARSTDGINWTTGRIQDDNNQAQGAQYLTGSATGFLSGGSGANTITRFSSDGTTWTSATTPSASVMCSGVQSYGSGRFMAFLNSGSHRYTTDNGATWNSTTQTYVSSVSAMGYVSRLGVMFAGAGNIIYYAGTPESVSWTVKNLQTYTTSGGTWISVVSDGTRFLASQASASTWFVTSTDGLTWTPVVANLSCGGNLAYGGGTFVSFTTAASTSNVFTSSDGATWTARTSLMASAYWVTYVGNKFIACHSSSSSVQYSPDGITWTSAATGVSTTNPRPILGQGGEIYIQNATTGYNLSSPNGGVTWLSRVNPYSSAYNAPVAYVDSASSGSIMVAIIGNRYHYSTSNFFRIAQYATTTDGVTWATRSFPFNGNWSSVIWDGSKFVVTSLGTNSPCILTSPDGLNWTKVLTTPQAGGTMTACVSNGTVHVAVNTSDTSAVAVSTDGKTWTPAYLPGLFSASMVAWNGSVFILVAVNNIVAMTSPDGYTWTPKLLPAAYSWIALCGNPATGRIVLGVSSSTTAYTSDDNGNTWTPRTFPYGSLAWSRCLWTGSLYVLTNTSNQFLFTSPDAVTWTQKTAYAGTVNMGLVAYGAGKLVMGLAGTGVVAYSTDNGDNWTLSATLGGTMSALAYACGKFFAIKSSPAEVYVSSDCANWKLVPQLRAGAVGAGMYSNVATDSYAVVFSGNAAYPSSYTTDGVTWKDVTIGTAASYTHISYSNGRYILGHDRGYTILSSTDLVNWDVWYNSGMTQVSSASGGNGTVWVVGAYGNYTYVSYDGVNWSLKNPGNTGNWSHIVTHGDMIVMTAYSSQYAYSTFDGITFSTSNSLPLNTGWNKLASYGATLMAHAMNSESSLAASTQSNAQWNLRNSSAIRISSSSRVGYKIVLIGATSSYTVSAPLILSASDFAAQNSAWGEYLTVVGE